jgi:hypothetical protein
MSKILQDPKNLDKAFLRLQKVYADMPETTGCMENLAECKSWCCSTQTPQVMYSEFLHSWQEILKYWTLDQILSLIEEAVRCYVSKSPVKGCIFADRKSHICKQHKTRCFNCRMYGIVPKEEFNPRYEKLKEMYKDNIEVAIRDQCNIVSVVGGGKVRTEMVDKWWSEIIDIEKLIGVDEKKISDGVDGSYRTYHDHLLLYLFPDQVLYAMTQIRLSKCSADEREEAIIVLISRLEKVMSSLLEKTGENDASTQENKDT